MTTDVDVVNRALQAIGTRTTVQSLSENSNEAIQANLVFEATRDECLRMAPWNASTLYTSLTYITSAPGTPENTSPATATWQRGQPAPPWAYEYQYPVDCLRPLWIVPQFITGFASGIPITTAVTGGAPQFWNGPPVKFRVATDLFRPVTAAIPNVGGQNYAVGDTITLAAGLSGSPPIGAPAQLLVTQVSGVQNAVSLVSVVSQIYGEATPQGGSYFALQTNPVAQGSSDGTGNNANFILTFGPQSAQRIILTNQEQAMMAMVRRVTDINVMDPLLIDAWVQRLASRLAMQLSGDLATANKCVNDANVAIMQGRTADGNEGLTVQNTTPDWIRARGFIEEDIFGAPGEWFNWGPLFPNF